MRIRILFVAALLVSGCSKPPVAPSPVGAPPPSQATSAPASQKSGQPSESTTPQETSAAGEPKPVAGSISQLGVLTPLPNAGQRTLPDGILVSSDRNFGIGISVALESTARTDLIMVLSIVNRMAKPVEFGAGDVTMTDAVGKQVAIIPKTLLPRVLDSDGKPAIPVSDRDSYWDDSVILAPNSPEKHATLFALCSKECQLPITIHVAVGGQAYQLSFGGLSSVQPAQPSESSTQAQAAAANQPPPFTQILDSLTLDDVTDRCGRPDSSKIGLESFLTYSNAFNTGPVVGTKFSTVDLFFNSSAHIDEGEVDGIPYGSHHSVPISEAELPKVMPCLLTGGVAR